MTPHLLEQEISLPGMRTYAGSKNCYFPGISLIPGKYFLLKKIKIFKKSKF